MQSLRRASKLVFAVAMVVTILAATAQPASAGWRRRTIIVENRSYVMPLPTATVYGGPIGTIVAPPVPAVYSTQVIVPSAARATYVAPSAYVNPVVQTTYVPSTYVPSTYVPSTYVPGGYVPSATYVTPTRMLAPSRVIYGYPPVIGD